MSAGGRVWTIVAVLGVCSAAWAQPGAAPSPPHDAPATPADVMPLAPENLWKKFPTPSVDAPFRPIAWPARIGKGLIVDIGPGMTRPEGNRSGTELPAMTVASVPDAVKLLESLGLRPGDWRVLVEGSGSYIVSVKPLPEGPNVPRRLRDPADLTFRHISGQEEGRGTVRIERTWFQYFAPGTREGNPGAKGLVVFMPGLFGTPEGTISGLTRVLRDHGFGVLRMVAQPARFTERLDFEIDPGGDLAEAGRLAAALIDGRAAECAYSVEAAVDHMRGARAEIAEKPVFVLGFSAGAITLPAVVARNPARYAGAVLVGGGCHWWHMLEVSNYRTMIDATRLNWTRPPTAAQEQALRDGYVNASTLDSYNAAQILKGKPTLFIMGSTDLAVPSPLGEVLWKRLGSPERIVEEGGHEVLFMQLPKHFERIADWMESHLPGTNGTNEERK